jgi:pimeloyl-ACP methyl ester carboxylesterase
MTDAVTDRWLFLRGLGREQSHWHTFPAQFVEGAAGTMVHTLDLPGAGTEHRRDCPVAMPALAADVRARWLPLRDAHPGARWHLLGISLGGMVAQQWAASHPDDFAHVVLVNTSAADHSLPWERMSLSVLRDLVRAVATAHDDIARERIVLEMATRLFPDRDALARTWAEYHRARPLQRRNLLRQLVAATRFRAPPRIDVPTLVLVGAGDRLAHPNCGRRLAAHYGATLREHPAAGHDLPLDDPAWVTETVRAFVQRV